MAENLRDTADQAAGLFARGRRFIGEVRSELGRVTWPTRREVWATTVVVILVSTLFGVYLYLVDIILSRLVAWAFKVLGG
jgi:preprotein translocase subunit SecE